MGAQTRTQVRVCVAQSRNGGMGHALDGDALLVGPKRAVSWRPEWCAGKVAAADLGWVVRLLQQ